MYDCTSEQKRKKSMGDHVDPRVIKTKKNIKETFKELLTEKTFDQITVKEICERSLTSRITFYTHYSDKYALLEDLFQDLNDELIKNFEALQKYNQADDPVVSYQNLLECLLDQFFSYQNIRSTINLEHNTILLYCAYHYMTDSTEELIRHYFSKLKPNYPPEQLSSFIVLGLYGYLHNLSHKTETDQVIIRKEAHNLLNDLLHSDIFSPYR